MAQKYQELSDKIVGLVGGKANVQFFTHCVTRLRFNVKDESAVKKDEIEKLPGVLGSQSVSYTHLTLPTTERV